VITKLLTAPRLNLGNPKPPADTPPAAPAKDTPEARLLRAVREVLAQTEDVGERFTDEARRMHYGEIEERGIRGQASREQAQSLREEGIPVFSLPVPPALKETLQ
jgi:hypothetical protein